MIVRPYYLDILKTYRDVPLVKILAGIRRCGKSTILDMLKDDLLGSGIAADHVIHLRYTSEELDDGMTAKQMYRDIKEKMTDGERYYLLLDEVQEVDGWEKAVNSLLEDSNTDIYVTGSNSKLMSSEISTYLTGRYISIPVFTLSFAEYLEFKKDSGRTPKELLNEYIRMGGFPIFRFNCNSVITHITLTSVRPIRSSRVSTIPLSPVTSPSGIISRTLTCSTVW